MSVVSESSPAAISNPLGRGRRIPPTTLISVVLLCGAVGFLLGNLYPPDRLMTHIWAAPEMKAGGAGKAPVTVPVRAPGPPSVKPTPAPMAVTPAPPVKAPPGAREEGAVPRAAAPRPATDTAPIKKTESGPRSRPAGETEPPAARVPAPNPPPAPEKAAAADSRPAAGADAPLRDEDRQQAQAGGDDAKKAAPKAGEKTRRKRHTARAKRRQDADGETAAASAKGPLSQLPVIGPAMGFVLP